MFMNLSRSRQGFSLIELMIVVAIMGILMVVAIPSYQNHIRRTRQAEGLTRLLDIKTAEEKFYALEDTYYIGGLAANATFRGMLNFDPTDTTIFSFNITTTAGAGAGQNFRVLSLNDLNGDGVRTDCWEITDSTDTPAKVTGEASCTADGEGLKFSFFD